MNPDVMRPGISGWNSEHSVSWSHFHSNRAAVLGADPGQDPKADPGANPGKDPGADSDSP